MKLTSFFKKFVFHHRSKKRYISVVKLQQKNKSGSGQQVAALCERFTEMQVTGDLSGPSSTGQDVVKYLKTQLL